jgi:hypothetical protein
MASTLYRVRDKKNKKFWNGSYFSVSLSDKGKSFKTRVAAERGIRGLLEYRSRYSTLKSIECDWEIVEYEVVETEKATIDITEYQKFLKLRAEVVKEHSLTAQLMDRMWARGVMDKIEFLFVLKPKKGQYYIDRDRIKECRAQLRQLGVKTRSFYETGGVFGMVDRSQAMNARLTLDPEMVIDLSKFR